MNDNKEIKYVWYDYWCIPQKNPTGEKQSKDYDERTEKQKKAFDRMLEHANVLYLGCKVLILADKTYVSRFWTMFEAWVAMRGASREGLGEEGERRWEVKSPLKANLAVKLEGVLIEELLTATVDEAVKMLKQPDIEVTNAKDKDTMIGRLKELDEEVRKDFREEEAGAEAAKAPGQKKVKVAGLMARSAGKKVHPDSASGAPAPSSKGDVEESAMQNRWGALQGR